MQAEDDRGDAVGETDGDDAERTTGVEREPHERDVVQRVAELACNHGEVQVTEVGAAKESKRRCRRLGRRRLELARDVEDGI